MTSHRPTRARLSLDGVWSFWPDIDGALAIEGLEGPWIRADERSARLGSPRPIRVPGVWQAQFEDLREWSGAAWYERDIDIPRSWDGRRVRMMFGAVDYFATVWVNGRLAGTHDGGYLPFALDVGPQLLAGERNTVTVRVLDPPEGGWTGPFQFAEIPHGKQSWYGPLGGIWQSAAIEATANVYVDRALIRCDLSGCIRATIRLGSPASARSRLAFRIRSPDGIPVATGELDIDPGTVEPTFETNVRSPSPWDPAEPNLYAVDIVVYEADRIIDASSERFGFRDVAIAHGRVLLNGRPVYLRGALDQDYHLDTIAVPPSNETFRDEMVKAKELGLNLLRCHVKVPDPRYLAEADRLGLLVWCELPNWQRPTEPARRRARETLAGMIERDANHPSVVAWTIANESWGLDLADAAQRRWLAETFARVRQLDPTRLIVDNSACPGNFHVRSDLNDFHVYRAVPDQAREWTAVTEGWVSDPASTYSPYGDAVRGGDEPMILSEFGAWGLPDPAGLTDERGGEPWWLDSGHRFSDGIVVPRGVHERFRDWGLASVFGSWERFIQESQEHQFEALKLEIEDLRRRDAIAGYVITELTDVHWECNGLLDMARRPKTYADRLRRLNGADVVIGTPDRIRARAGERVTIEVVVAHWSDRNLSGGKVAWKVPELELGGELGSGEVRDAAATVVGRIDLDVPQLDRPIRARTMLRILDASGREVNRNHVELVLFPAEPSVGGSAGEREVVVAQRWSDELAAWMERGGRAVILAAADDALPSTSSIGLRRREGSVWKGDWAQGMGWLRPLLTEGIPVGPRMDLAFADLAPQHVVTGYRPSERDDVLSGMYVGWIHATVATIAGFRHGRGAGIICALPLDGASHADPLAASLLDRLVVLAGDPAFAPTKAWG